jgi:superfamily II RNA helicase
VPSDGDLELAFYDQFLWSKNLQPYAVQEQAITTIFTGKSVLVTVPTGTGKTMMAKAALYRAFHRNERAVYTTPLRALTEEKYRELCADFGEGTRRRSRSRSPRSCGTGSSPTSMSRRPSSS